MAKKPPTEPPKLTLVKGDAPAKPGPKPKLEHSAQLVEQIRALGKIQATVQEVASVLRVSERTLQNFFAMHADAKDAHEDGKREGHASLRRKQYEMAGKNAAMSIWLGKQYLNQREPVQQIETGKPGDFSNLTNEQLDEVIKRLQDNGEADGATKH
jgi:hypothetical protein